MDDNGPPAAFVELDDFVDDIEPLIDEETIELESAPEPRPEPEPEPESKGRTSESKLDVDKVIGYFRTKTEQVANALEQIIAELRPTWGHDRLAPFVAVLDDAREHIAGYHNPIVWQTEFEARRWACQHNRHVDAGKRAKVVPSEDGVMVIAPK